MKFSFFLLKRIRLSFGRLNRSQFPLFAALFLLGISPAAADPFDLVPETVSENYQILYEIDLPENNAFRNANPVPYLQDHRESIPEFDRVAYFLKLEKNETT